MTNVIKNISLYLSFVKTSMKEMLIYRLDCIVGMLSQIFTELVEILFIWIVFQNTETLAGWTYFIIIWNYIIICRNF